MPFSTTDINGLLSYWGSNDALYMSAHSAFSATGANEISGGSYARVAVTWAAPSSGSMSLSGTPYSINIPASSTVEWVGFWSASSGGTFAGMFPGGNAIAYGFAVPSSSGTFLAPGSSFINTTSVVLMPTAGSSLPSGVTQGTIYTITSASGDTFQLSGVSLSSDGSGLVQGIVTETFGSAGTYSVSGVTVTGA